MRRRNLLFAVTSVLAAFGALLLSQGVASAQTQVQELLLPFSAGVIEVQADETYSGDVVHPAVGAIAFDLTDVRRDADTDVLSIGVGRIRLACAHTSGSAVLQFQADGIAGDFYYVHMDVNTLSAGISETWSRIDRGEIIGGLFPRALTSQPGDSCAQFSTGPHLHLDLPRSGMVIDGVVFNEGAPNDTDLISSTNRTPGERETAVCAGENATIVGTTRDDVLQGTEGRDVIAGLQGDDLVFGLGGDDIICGGFGEDFLIGGDGFDVIFGAQGDDTIVAASGSTGARRDDAVGGGRFFGGAGNDVIFGSNRWDRMQGGPGDDRLTGFDGRDWIRGGPGADFLDGGSNIDDLHGGNGSDVISAGGGDTVAGGAGPADICQYTNQPASIRGCETIVSP